MLQELQEQREQREAHARAPESALVQARMQAKERAQVSALAQERARARVQARDQVRVQRVRAQAQAQAWAQRMDVEAQMVALARVEARAEARAEALTRTEVRAEALALAEVRAEALAQAALARAEALAKALEVAGFGVLQRSHPATHGDAMAKALEVASFVPSHVTYGEVLADSKLKDIIYSIEPENRHDLARGAWHLSKHWWFIQTIAPITRLPRELLHQILLIIIDNGGHSPLTLMRVSKLWYSIVTGLWASLKLGTTTPSDAVTSKLKRNQWLLDVVVDTKVDRGHSTLSSDAYQAIFAAIEATPRWRSFIVESFPAQADLPEHLVTTGLQQCSGAVMSRLRTFKIKCSCEMSPLLERLLSILGTTASKELTTIEINSANMISFLVPTYSSIFRFVQDLRLDTPRLDTPRLPNPVDLLPHLHQLVTFTASHLSFPDYPNDANLSLVHTLRHLSLRAVSIQWMSGRTFHALESCTLLFPLHGHVLHTFSTNLPNCNDLTFQGYPLDILNGISAQDLTRRTVKCACFETSEGTRQLYRFSSHFSRENRLAPRILHINIEATDQGWITALAFMSNLEELVIGSAQPSSLGAKVLQSLIICPDHVGNLDSTSTLVGGCTWRLVCPSLKRFGLRYRRWLRSSEHFDLIPELVSIIWSREQAKVPLESFRIWKESDQEYPVELVHGSRLSITGFELLYNVKGRDLVRLVNIRFGVVPLSFVLF